MSEEPPKKKQKTDKYDSSKKISARLWDNVPAEFTTKNTRNSYGDSKYTVEIYSLKRHAPINTKRKPKQIYLDHPNRHICYIDKDETKRLREAVKDMGGKKRIAMCDVEKEKIVLTSWFGGEFCASFQPRVDLRPFDFTYLIKDGMPSFNKAHLGHEINTIVNVETY